MESIHGSYGRSIVFKRSSPQPEIFSQSPKATLDMGSTYKSFLAAKPATSPKQSDAKRQNESPSMPQNPRLTTLERFKEISRMMTHNFLAHKRLEARYEKTSIPKAELE